MHITQRFLLSLGAAALLFTASAQPAPTPAAKMETAKAAPKIAPVDINSATQAELETVKGIGPATAKKIIAARPYATLADLSKAGLSKSQIETMGPSFKVGAAAPAAAPAAAKAATAKGGPTPTLPQAPGGGAGKVWVNKDSKIFHREGTTWYGKTKDGAYMTEAEAVKAGYRESKEAKKEAKKK